MKLDESDYENIYLRVRERLWRQIFAAMAIVVAILGITSYGVFVNKIEKITEAAIKQHVESKEFQAAVVESTQSLLRELDKKASEINSKLQLQEIRAAQLAGVPLVVEDNGLFITSISGDTFFIQTGHVLPGEQIAFRRPFKETPAVLLTLDMDSPDEVTRRIAIKTGDINPIPIATPEGFEIQRGKAPIQPLKFRWIAIGQ